MMTTKNCMTPETPTPAERMAHARAAKAAKARPPTTTVGAHTPLGDGTPSASAPQQPHPPTNILRELQTKLEQGIPASDNEHLKTILLELRTMFSHATPRGQELVAQALALLPDADRDTK